MEMENTFSQFSFNLLKVTQKGLTFFLGTINAKELLPLCAGLRRSDIDVDYDLDREDWSQYEEDDFNMFTKIIESSTFSREIEHIRLTTYAEDEPYQRILDETRIRKIATYLLEENSIMPNAIILAAKDETEVSLKEISDRLVNLNLTWNQNKKPLNIIDGQHRIEGLRRLVEEGHKEFEEFQISFVLLIDIPFYMQAELFAVINGQQKPVNRSRIYDLLGYLPLDEPKHAEKAYRGDMAISRFCHHVTKVLNTSKKSPWYDLIKMRGTGDGIVTQAAIIDHLKQLVMPRKESSRLKFIPILFPFFSENDLVGISKVCILYFLGIKNAFPDHWGKKEYLFGKTNGVAVMFQIFHDLTIIEGNSTALTSEKTQEYWSKAPLDRITQPPVGGSKGYQRELHEAIMREIIGDEYEKKVKSRIEAMKDKLREAQALY